ncbi:MAG TPA: phosphoribosylanthranilate isomerase [Cyclobacteriaceae bacterium]|nr:phosphoribosylanthranilate isomerase [Cyclobacteriaceae bacterium]HMV09347.1 phosphoribosylanthranilate isomerase [Cyclobacteriaceae bacterium]HMV91655.1 phosphoribosylanthranilate isomerase [Cyclobacteriaceae bacterium]HMX01004.1 phosphoribosylanthranilate isomerase [Cyclobacteriaceae bacterium]HMX51144.1 phosphoribosylanthranilate isomerase [Cyclobacteriaceae bacterium]
MNVKLKICGMRDAANITEVAALQPDYLGFIFYDKSPRFVGADFKMPVLGKHIKKVGVFVNEKTDTVLHFIEKYSLDLVQLHGTETADECRVLHAKGVNVIKAFSVDDDFDFEVTKPFEKAVTYFLFDTKGKYFGGNAKTFDWTLLRKYNQKVPFFLSGGISPENVSAIREIADLNIYSIDVNSGVEDRPAVKNVNKVKAIQEIINAL